jgi:WD40 repeat protein
VTIIETGSGRPAAPLRHPSVVTRIQFHPDGRHLLTQRSDGTLTVWDLAGDAPGRAVARVNPSEYIVSSAGFGPSGRDLRGVAVRLVPGDRNLRSTLVQFAWQVDDLKQAILSRLMRRELTPRERQEYGLDQ